MGHRPKLGSYGKNRIFGPKTEILGPKKGKELTRELGNVYLLSKFSCVLACPWLISTSQYCLLFPNCMLGKYLQDWMSCRNSRFRVNVTRSSYVRGNYEEEKQDLIYNPLQMYVDSDPKKLQLMRILLRSLQKNLESWNIYVISILERRKPQR